MWKIIYNGLFSIAMFDYQRVFIFYKQKINPADLWYPVILLGRSFKFVFFT